MERLLKMDKEAFIREMQSEVRRQLEAVADAVNGARDGAVINGSEMAVRDAMDELKRRVFEKALQMRVDSTESAFSPSPERGGESPPAPQGKGPAKKRQHKRAR